MNKPSNTEAINAAVGRLVKTARTNARINQTVLAPKLGLDQSALSRVENGHQSLTAAQWVQLCMEIGRHDTLTMRVKTELGL